VSDPIISFVTENDKEFTKAIDKAAEQVSDLRIPFGLIANHFYKGNKKIFSLKGPGLYEDLSDNYKKVKKRDVGFEYPILKRKGRLAKSLSSKNDTLAEFFVGRQTLIMGTKDPVAKFHQSDRPRKKKEDGTDLLPQRKVVFIDGGPAETAKDALISGRVEAWVNIISDYVKQVLTGDAQV
jgi:phage gpG-like protein